MLYTTKNLLERLLFILCFLFFNIAALYSQSHANFIFKNINNTDGLPNNTIGAITKDDLGFIWFGTTDGLCRYEGPNSIKIFKADNPIIEGGLQSSNIRSLFFDSKNNLWIGTRLGGLTKFHQPSGIWKTYRHDKNDRSSISNDEILSIAEDKEGRIWLGTEDGLNVFRAKTEDFVRFKVDPNNPNAIKGKAVLSVIGDDQGRIWAGTWAGGLNLLIPSKDGNIEKASFKNFLPNEEDEAQHVWKIYQDRQNRFWVGTRGAGLFLMELPQREDENPINWEPRFHAYGDGQGDKGIIKKYLEDIYQDRKGNLWIGTVDGLSFISSDQLTTGSPKLNGSSKPEFRFQHYLHEANNPNTIAHNDIISIFEDNQGLVWFGTMSGASLYNWFTNQFDVFTFKDIAENAEIQSFYIDNNDIGWIGNEADGIFKYDFQKQEKIDFNKDEIPWLDNYASCLYTPDDKYLYMGTGSGVTLLEMETNKCKNYPLPQSIEKQFNEFIVRSILKDDNNRIWVGSQQGLFSINESNGV